jgi:hypothetical protein
VEDPSRKCIDRRMQKLADETPNSLGPRDVNTDKNANDAEEGEWPEYGAGETETEDLFSGELSYRGEKISAGLDRRAGDTNALLTHQLEKIDRHFVDNLAN